MSSSPSHSWLRLFVRGFVLLLVVLTAAGFFYENIAESRDRRFNAMSGKLVSVGDSKMHIDCVGQGTPTVILESGLGDSAVSWRKVQPQIAKFVRVCSYDRAGLGYSDSSSAPRTSKVIAGELHALLQAAAIAPPYILVGHSMGGYDVRLYASLYQSEVVGMVLVDASHPEQENRLPDEIKAMRSRWIREAKFLEYTMPLGLPRFFGFCDDDPVVRASECNFHTAREAVVEMQSFQESATETAATGTLGDLPLVVLSHDPNLPSSELPADLAKRTNDAWEKMQEELAHLSTRGTQAIVTKSSHYIQIDRPDTVIQGVRNVVDQARGAQPPAVRRPLS